MNDRIRQAQEHYERGNKFDDTGDLEHAIQEWLKVIELDPDNWQAHDSLADAYEEQGKYDLAEKEYREVLRIDANDPDAHRGLAEIFDERNDFVNAVTEYRETLRLAPNDETRRDLVWALIEQGDVIQARIEFDQVTDVQEDDDDLWLRLGDAAEKHGEKGTAIAAYKEALEINPDLAEARAKLKKLAPGELKTLPGTTTRYVLMRGAIILAAFLLLVSLGFAFMQMIPFIGALPQSFIERRFVLQADRSLSSNELDASARIFSARFESIGVVARINSVAPNQIIVRVRADAQVTPAVWEQSSSQQLLEFVDLGDISLYEGTMIVTSGSSTAVGPGTPIPAFADKSASGARVYRTVMTGNSLRTAHLAFERTTNQPYIQFTLTDEGRKIFADYTSKNVGKYLGITLNGKVISSPRLNGAITQGE